MVIWGGFGSSRGHGSPVLGEADLNQQAQLHDDIHDVPNVHDGDEDDYETDHASHLKAGHAPRGQSSLASEEQQVDEEENHGHFMPARDKSTSPQPFQKGRPNSAPRRNDPLRSSAPSFMPRSTSERRASISSVRASSSGDQHNLRKSAVISPSHTRPTITVAAPFNLSSVRRHNEAVERRQREAELKRREEEERRKFKARPILSHRNYQPPRRSLPLPIMTAAGFSTEDEPEERLRKHQVLEAAQDAKAREKQEDLQKRKEKLESELREFEESCRFRARPLPKFYRRANQ